MSTLGTFFWLSMVLMGIKYAVDEMPWFGDGLFVCIVIVFMYVQNVAFMSSKCASGAPVVAATLLPWLLMFAPLMAALQLFPEWKGPFSNTFGYVVARMAGGTHALTDLIDPSQALEFVYQDPSLLLNQFTLARFDKVLNSLQHVMVQDTSKVNRLKRIVKLKELVSEWVWLMLGASVATSTSYTMMMKLECTSSPDDMVNAHSVAMAQTPEEEEETTYVVTE